jgi:hypothetical protein
VSELDRTIEWMMSRIMMIMSYMFMMMVLVELIPAVMEQFRQSILGKFRDIELVYPYI